MESKYTREKRVLSIILLFTLMLSFFASFVSSQENLEDNRDKVTIYFFWGDGCPHCDTQKPYLEKWENKYSDNIEIRMFETWVNRDNVKLFQQVASAYGVQARGVPTTFIGERHWVGFSSAMAPEMERYIEGCINNGCESPLNDLDSGENSQKKPIEVGKSELCIHVFLDSRCPQCRNVLPHLDSLNEEYDINIEEYDVSFEDNKTLFKEFKENYGLKAEMYPTIFIGEKYISGEESIKSALEKEIENCLESGCPCPISKVNPYTPITTNPKDVTFSEKQTINIPLLGEIDLSSMSLGVVTALIGFVDGFNPCSLWVLTFLLGIVIYTGSRKKIIVVGLTFLFVTTAVYGLFMVGLLNVFKYVGYLGWIQWAVALIAGAFALVNIKDYFWYKKGISFTISDKYKPKIFKSVRNLMKGESSIWTLISGTTIMALGIVLIELPCTAGFPVIWTNIMAENNVTGTSFILLLSLYLAIYLLDELVVFGTVAFTLKSSKFQEKHGRILKLIGGMIMLAMAIVLIVKPELMNDIGGALLVFGIAIAVSFILLWLHRKILPKYGITIGTESLGNKTLNEEDEDGETEKEDIKEDEDGETEKENNKNDNKKQVKRKGKKGKSKK